MDIMKLRIHLRTKCAHLRLPVLVTYGPALGGASALTGDVPGLPRACVQAAVVPAAS